MRGPPAMWCGWWGHQIIPSSSFSSFSSPSSSSSSPFSLATSTPLSTFSGLIALLLLCMTDQPLGIAWKYDMMLWKPAAQYVLVCFWSSKACWCLVHAAGSPISIQLIQFLTNQNSWKKRMRSPEITLGANWPKFWSLIFVEAFLGAIERPGRLFWRIWCPGGCSWALLVLTWSCPALAGCLCNVTKIQGQKCNFL